VSGHRPKDFVPNEERVNQARWEKKFDKVYTPFEQFVKEETTSGLLLIAAAMLALVMINSGLAHQYEGLLHISVGFNIAGWEMNNTLHHWINDGLMTLFFFVVGLELKREILVGELRKLRQAALPIVAAIGGMLIPALIYFAVNPVGDSAIGWGIPMATDIAFALGVIALLSSRVPKALITFLVALAIVDDIGAVIIIAGFYTEQLSFYYLGVAGAVTALLVAMNMGGVRTPFLYFIGGVLLWLALLQSGVHATLAGVITAFTIPTLSRYNAANFSKRMRETLDRFDASHRPGETLLNNQEVGGIVQTLESGVRGVEAPLARLEHNMHLPVALIILPLFAFFNAGVEIDFGGLGAALVQSVTLGVGLGLVFGKFIGIAGASWVAVRFGLAELPEGVRWGHITGAALLAGIGFTMSIFIADLAFAGQPEMIAQAKLGIIVASVIAGVGGYIALRNSGGTRSKIGSIVD